MRWPQGAGLGLCGDWWDCVRPPPELRFAMGGVRWKRTLVVACQKVANAWANQTQSSGCNSPIKSFRRIPKGWATNSLIDLCDSSMGYTDPRTGRPIYIGKGQEQQNLRPPQRPGLPLLPRSELSPQSIDWQLTSSQTASIGAPSISCSPLSLSEALLTWVNNSSAEVKAPHFCFGYAFCASRSDAE